MKLFALLTIVGLAAASYSPESGVTSGLKWQPGQEYVYTYTGRLLTGLPELNEHHFSGIGIKCQIHLQVRSDSRLVLQIRDAHYTRVNERLSEVSGDQKGHNWRHVQMPTYSPIPTETMRLLEKATLFEVSPMSGRVTSLTVSVEEPEWSINFKKALIVLFQTGRMESNQIQSSVVEGHSMHHGIPTVWTTFEEGTDGECETNYELMELPETMALTGVDTEGERLISRPELCPTNSKLYELIKTRNLNNCRRTSIYSFQSPGHFSCAKDGQTGSCGEMWTRSSITRYTMCGTSSHRLMVQSIVNEGEINQYLMGAKTEKVMTGSRQVLKLVSSGSIQTTLESTSGSIVITSLLYGKKDSKIASEPMSELVKDIYGEHVNKEQLVTDVSTMLKEIVHSDLFTKEGLPEKEISYKVLTASRLLKIFDTTMLEKVYENVVRSEQGERKEVMRNILVDTVVMSGSPQSIKFFKHLVERRELSHSQTSALLVNLPRSIFAPTHSLLEEIYELVISEPIRSDHVLYSNAILAFSHLLQKACIAPERNSRYPVSYMGKFCNKESSVITEKFIPYLQRELTHSGSSMEKKNVVIVALGLIAHEQVLPILLPVIEEESENNVLPRNLAIYSLINVGRNYPKRVLPVVSAIYINKAEPTAIRIAAFNSIMSLKPDMSLLQKIATLTWTEHDMEMLKVVNTAFYTLSNQVTMQDYKPESSTLIRRVRLVYPLIKKTGGVFPSSATIYTNEFLQQMKLGYERTLSWVGCRDSIVPATVYDKISYFVNDFKFTPLELGVHLCDLVPELMDIVSGTAHKNTEEIKSQLAEEWRQTIDQLRLKIRQTASPEGFFFLRIFEDSNIFHSFSRSTGEELSRVLKTPSLLKSYLSGEKRFNYQRTLNLISIENMTPSELGFPIFTQISMPTVISVHGYVNSKIASGYGKMALTFKSLIDTRLTGSVGTVCPISGEKIVTGIDSRAMVNLPFDMTLSTDLSEGKLNFNIKLTGEYANCPLDLVYLRVLPYTVRYHSFSVTPVFKTEHFKTILTATPMHEKNYELGQYLGLDLQMHLKTETPFTGVRFLMQKLSLMNNNPVNYMRFLLNGIVGMTHSGLPSVRRHEMRLVYNPSTSSTKEIEFTLKFGAGIKEKNQSIRYVKIEPITTTTGSSGSQILPMKIVSKPIREISGHVQRQEKIKSVLERLSIDTEGRAFTVSVATTLKGSRTRTYVYSATVGTGKSGLKQKWDIKLESNMDSNKICVVGDVAIPFFSIWNLNQLRSEDPVFHYRNTIGYGNECSESKIVARGFAKTSELQKKLALESPQGKEYLRLLQKGTSMIQLSELAEIVRRQISLLDEYHYQVDMINVPSTVVYYHKMVVDALQVYWMPYISYTNSVELPWSRVSIPEMTQQMTGSGRINLSTVVKTKIHPTRRTFDVEIIDSGSLNERFVYTDVPMVYPLHYVFPMSYVQCPVSSIVKVITGKPLYPTCAMESRHITTFDNRTLKAEIDDCFHLLSGDCSKNMQYGVLVRSLESAGRSSYRSTESEKEIKIFLKETTVTMKPEGGRVVVKINGSPIEIPRTEMKQIKSSSGSSGSGSSVIAEITMTKDNVIVLKSSKITVYFDGKLIKLEGSILLKNKLCGLCGDNNNEKMADVTSPRMCLLSRPELLVASHRVSLPSHGCSALPTDIKMQLHRETTERCVKTVHQTTKVTETYTSSIYGNEQCLNHHHEIVDKYTTNEYCFSRIPILECGSNCHPVGVREKTVTFTCMTKNHRRSEHIADLIRSGEIVSSLKEMPVTFSTVRSIPVTCRPYGSSQY